MTPRVTAVIPTAGRPRLVVRAVESALAQTVRGIEVVVVIDGPDAVTESALSTIADPRLRVIRRPKAGPGAARNAGVAAAAAEWVAFLDDDDLWAPAKLQRQLSAVESSALAYPIVVGRVSADDGGGRARVWPRRLPDPGEALGDYLLVRRTPFWGESLVHTSTILTRRELLEDVRFREDMACHEDMDWLLRATRVEGAGLVFVPDATPLATWNVDRRRERASRRGDWRESLAWARLEHPLISRRAYAGFLLTNVAAHAARQRSASALWRLPWEAFRRGRPRVRDLLLFAGIWLLPESARTRAADLWHRRRRGGERERF
ncbi:MAG TPA: glycosyltransferase [Gemmatimonadota bacterium]|nr:glycosyltransferase [Gemmatimonadota bacterium]